MALYYPIIFGTRHCLCDVIPSDRTIIYQFSDPHSHCTRGLCHARWNQGGTLMYLYEGSKLTSTDAILPFHDHALCLTTLSTYGGLQCKQITATKDTSHMQWPNTYLRTSVQVKFKQTCKADESLHHGEYRMIMGILSISRLVCEKEQVFVFPTTKYDPQHTDETKRVGDF